VIEPGQVDVELERAFLRGARHPPQLGRQAGDHVQGVQGVAPGIAADLLGVVALLQAFFDEGRSLGEDVEVRIVLLADAVQGDERPE